MAKTPLGSAPFIPNGRMLVTESACQLTCLPCGAHWLKDENWFV